MFDNILVYIDHNLRHTSLLSCAMNVASANKSKVTLIGTVSPLNDKLERSISESLLSEIYEEKYAQVQVAFDNFKAQLKIANIECETIIAKGTPYIEVSKQVINKGHDLVMLLADDHQSGLSKVFFGTTQMHLLRHCPSAVWIVKPESTPVAQHILAPVDIEFFDEEESSINQAIVDTTRSMAQRGNLTVKFMHVWTLFGEHMLLGRGGVSRKEIKKMRKKRKLELKQELNNLVHSVDWLDIPVSVCLPRNENPASEIIATVQKKKVDLLVMGTLCRTGIKGFFIGNTAEKILNEVSCSVLALKPQGFKSPIE